MVQFVKCLFHSSEILLIYLNILCCFRVLCYVLVLHCRNSLEDCYVFLLRCYRFGENLTKPTQSIRSVVPIPKSIQSRTYVETIAANQKKSPVQSKLFNIFQLNPLAE